MPAQCMAAAVSQTEREKKKKSLVSKHSYHNFTLRTTLVCPMCRVSDVQLTFYANENLLHVKMELGCIASDKYMSAVDRYV